MPATVDATPADTAPMTLDVLRSETVTTLRITGRLTDSGSHHLADTLQWLFAAGDRDVSLHLDTISGADSGCLQLLRWAKAHLAARQGRLSVTSDHADTRALLTGIGLG